MKGTCADTSTVMWLVGAEEGMFSNLFMSDSAKSKSGIAVRNILTTVLAVMKANS